MSIGKLNNSIVQIVGPNVLQNNLLSSFLKSKMPVQVKCCPDLQLQNEILYVLEKYRRINCNMCPHRTTPLGTCSSSKGDSLLMVDCYGINAENLWTELLQELTHGRSNCYVTFFNVAANSEVLSQNALKRNIRGIFSIHDSDPELILKGISAMLRGELWYSRAVLSQYFSENFQQKRQTAPVDEYSHHLTIREKEILQEILAGHSNKAIANNLCISIHTVKTHIYNIFKKINVKNRIQAIRWASSN